MKKIEFLVLCLLGCQKELVGPPQESSEMRQFREKVDNLQKAEQELLKLKEVEERQNRIGQYAINMMNRTYLGRQLSDARKLTLARIIVRVVNDVFETEEHMKAFIAVLAIESQFASNAQSPTGPRGLSQVARAAAKEGLTDCGLGKFNDNDVWTDEINLMAGACYFRQMLEINGNDVFLAIVSYNAGPASESAKIYAKGGDLKEIEPLKYVAKFAFLKRSVSDKKEPGANAYVSSPVSQKGKE